MQPLQTGGNARFPCDCSVHHCCCEARYLDDFESSAMGSSEIL